MPLRSGIVELHGDYSYRSKEQFQIVAAGNDQKGYGLVGARLTYRARDDRWSVALFGTNLTDKRYRTAGRGTLLQQVGFAYSSIGLPRQIGLQVNRRILIGRSACERMHLPPRGCCTGNGGFR